MRPSDRDTIVAIATAPGEGAIGIIRLSGDEAISMASCSFHGKEPLDQLEDRRLTFGRLIIRDQFLDEVLVSVMKLPRWTTCTEANC